jgi:hypothetical protein
VDAFGSDARSPANVGKHRPNDLTPDLGLHIGKFVEDDAIEIRPARRIRIVGAVKTNYRAAD